MPQLSQPDLPAAVTRQLDDLMAAARACLGANLIGVYLHGSLALGCFNPRRSDIDLLVVTHSAMAAAARRDLAGRLLALSSNPAPVEISVLVQRELTPWRHPAPYDFHFSEAWRTRFEAGLAAGDPALGRSAPPVDGDLAAHVTILNQRGLCLAGPPIHAVFPTVPRADYVDSILGDVLSVDYGLAGPLDDPVYVILNGCRTLAYLQTGAILSKAEGGRWALSALPAALHEVVNAALTIYSRHDGAETTLSHAAAAEFAQTMLRKLADQ